MLQRTGALLIAAILLLALNLFGLVPLANRLWGPQVTNPVYFSFRVLIFVGLSYALTRFASRNRYQAISLTTFVAFVDQVVFNGAAILIERNLRPESFPGATPTGIVVTLMIGFITFAPIVVILAYLGTQLGRQADTKSGTSK